MTLQIRESQQWKNWKLAQLNAERQILEGLLLVVNREYDWFEGLHGANLETRFGCESEDDLQPFREDRESWKQHIEDIVVEGIVNGNPSAFLSTQQRSCCSTLNEG